MLPPLTLILPPLAGDIPAGNWMFNLCQVVQKKNKHIHWFMVKTGKWYLKELNDTYFLLRLGSGMRSII